MNNSINQMRRDVCENIVAVCKNKNYVYNNNCYFGSSGSARYLGS